MVAGALARIERAFSAALARLEAAETFADAEDEVSNALHHLYRLWELAQRSQGAKRECLPDVTQVLLCLRGADTHQVVRISHGATRLPRTYPLSYKVPIFDLIDNRGIDDPKLQAAFLKSVRGRAADKLLPEAFKEIRSLIK